MRWGGRRRKKKEEEGRRGGRRREHAMGRKKEEEGNGISMGLIVKGAAKGIQNKTCKQEEEEEEEEEKVRRKRISKQKMQTPFIMSTWCFPPFHRVKPDLQPCLRR